MTSKIVVNNIEADAGVSTVFFNSDIGATDGTLNIDGNLTVDGVITYEDVTSVDSVGIVTAQSGIHVTGGSVGIGTDNPSDKLSIYAAPNSLVLGAKDTTRGNHIFQLLADDSAGNGELRLYQNSGSGTHLKTVEIASSGVSYFTGGNVGVNETSPVRKLHVKADNAPVARFERDTGDGEILEIRDFNNNQIGGFGSDTGDLTLSAYNSNNLRIETGGSERLRITSAGNLGIGGLTNPGALLSIPAGESNTPRLAIESAVDDNDFTITQYEDGNGTYTMLGQNVKLNSGGNNTILDSAHRTAGILLDARNHGAITFLTGGANSVGENVKIDSSGNIGINSTSPGRKLDVVDSGANGSVIRSRVTTNNGGFLAYEALNSSGTSVFSVSHNGRINLSENIVFASGQGIDFSATGNGSGSMSSELLDDYEEGTWTPTSGTGMGALTNANGTYVKIGRLVMVNFYFSTASVSTSGTSVIEGLPYDVADTITGTSVEATSVAFEDNRMYLIWPWGNTDNIAFETDRPIQGSTSSTSQNMRGSATYIAA